MELRIPYGRTHFEFEIPDKRLKAVLKPKLYEIEPELRQDELVKRALENPIGSSRLRELAKRKEKILIITSDHTRPVPSKSTMPLLLEEIRGGNPNADITILLATGLHRLTTEKEKIDKFGERMAKTEKIVCHNSTDENSLIEVGTLPSGGKLIVNKLAVESDLVVAEGFIEPHFFAGFTGGCKSVLPGISGRATVLANHCFEFVAHPKSRAGILDNPLQVDMRYAARAINLAFILNVVLGEGKKIINVFAGDREKAHYEGCKFVGESTKVERASANIVITSNGGYPEDQNIYQTVKGMTAAEACVKRGGAIITISACNDGHGGKNFHEMFAKADSPQAVTEKIMKTPPGQTLPDQWEAQVLARVLNRATVIIVTDECPPDVITDMHMQHAFTVEEAIEKAEVVVGRDSDIVVIPNGVAVIVC